MFVTIEERPHTITTWWMIGSANKREVQAVSGEYPKILRRLYETSPQLYKEFNKDRLRILNFAGGGISIVLLVMLSGHQGLRLPVYIGAIPGAIWFVMLVSYAAGVQAVSRINKRLAVERESLKRSGKLISQDSPALSQLIFAAQGNRELLERHKSEVDLFLLDPNIRRAEELIGESNLSPEKVTDLRSGICAKATAFTRQLQVLDQPHQKLEAQRRAEEQSEKVFVELDQEARRQTADQEAEQLTHLLDDEQ